MTCEPSPHPSDSNIEGDISQRAQMPQVDVVTVNLSLTDSGILSPQTCPTGSTVPFLCNIESISPIASSAGFNHESRLTGSNFECHDDSLITPQLRNNTPEEGDDKLLSQRQTLEPRTIDIVDENDPQILNDMIFRNPDTGVDLPDAVVRPISRTSTPMDPDREIHLESITVAVSESQIPSQNPSFRSTGFVSSVNTAIKPQLDPPSSATLSVCSSPVPEEPDAHVLSTPPDSSQAYDQQHFFPSSPCSSLPSSSPLQLFSSSPLASSQSSEPRESDIVMGNHNKADLLYVVSSLPLSPSSSPRKTDLEMALRPDTISCAGFKNLKEEERHVTHDDEFTDENVNPITSTSNAMSTTSAVTPVKRKLHSLDASSPSHLGDDDCADVSVPKRIHSSPPYPVPTTRRPTPAAQKLQHKKLTTPFRSPLMKKNKATVLPETPVLERSQRSNNVPNSGSPLVNLETAGSPPVPSGYVANKVRTKRAAAPFKSPLSTSSAGSSGAISSVRLTPTIQALERKVQLLKRAVKVKKDGEEEVLEKLVKKWMEAGREVAYELWGLVKDMGEGEPRNEMKGNRGFEGWGWQSENDQKWMNDEKKGKERCCEDEEERPTDTLGTMLKQLGIAPETLGWDEEEGQFSGE